MNTSPFLPQQSLAEQKARSRSRLKVAVYCIIAVNVFGLAALLLQGCKREQPLPPPESTEAPATQDTNPAPVEPTAPTTNVAPVAAEPPAAPAPSTTEYVVVKGDSFFIIGKRLGVPWKAIAAANPGVDSSKLKIGQKLVIPAASTSAAAPATSMTESTGEAVYVVKSGDTLTKIAKDHGTTYKAIKAANNLTTDKIKVGQKLKIPSKEAAAAPAPEPAPAATPEPAAAPEPAPATVTTNAPAQ